MEGKYGVGVIGGVIAGVLKDIPDAVFHYGFKITRTTFWDYAGLIALKRHPDGIGEHIYSFVNEIIFSILVGVIYVHLFQRLKTGHLIRGGIFGAVIWFLANAAFLVFRIDPGMIQSDFITSVINFFNSVIYGIVLAYAIHWIEQLKTSKAGVRKG